MRENLASFDSEVAFELANEDERSDLWTDIDVPVEAIRALLDELARRAEIIERAKEVIRPFSDCTTQSDVDNLPSKYFRNAMDFIDSLEPTHAE